MTIRGIIIRNKVPGRFEKDVASWLQQLTGSIPGYYLLENDLLLPVEGFTSQTSPEDLFLQLHHPQPETNLKHPILYLQEEELEAAFNHPSLPRQLINTPTFTISLVFRSNHQAETISAGRYRALPYSPEKTKDLISREIALLTKQSLQLLTEQRKPLLFPAMDEPDNNQLKVISKFRHRILQLFTSYKWNIGIIHQPIQEVAAGKGPFEVEWLKEAPGDDFKADPFGWTDNSGLLSILFEYYDAKNRTGHLRKFDQHGEQHFLKLSHHLSYPFLIQLEDQQLMVPESADSKSTIAYRLNADSPKVIAGMLEGEQIVDPTIFQHENRWWLFCTKKEHQGADLRLYVYYGESPLGPWIPHPANPVKTDICSSRPGGTPFYLGDKLIRPAQDSSKGYGSALQLMEITALTTTTFKEHLYRRLEPAQFKGPYQYGIHTLSAAGNKTLIDGKRRKFSLQPFLRLFVK